MRLKDLYYFNSDDLNPRYWMVNDNIAYHLKEPLNIRYSEILQKYILLLDVDGCKIQIKIPWWLSMKYRRSFDRIFKESRRHALGSCLRMKEMSPTAKKIERSLRKEQIFMRCYSELVSEKRYLAWLELSKLQSSTETFCKFIRESIADVKGVTLDGDRCTIHFEKESQVCIDVDNMDLFSRFEKDITTDISITLPHFVRNK